MTLTQFTNKRTEILNNLRKTNKGGAAYELHFNQLRILHVKAGAEVLQAAPAM